MTLKIKRRENTQHVHPATAKVHATVEKDNLVRLNVQLDKKKRQALKTKAAADGTTIHDVINQMVDRYLEP